MAFSLVGAAAQLSITPKAPPVVPGGGAYRFTANRPVEWSMAAGSQGSIDADGTYHAPAHVKAKQSLAGCQVLPNNHVFNTRIDQLPVHPKSASWMHAVDATGRQLVSGQLRLNLSFPVNAIDSHVPSEAMVFAYSPNANGPFRILPPSEFKMESGYYSDAFSGVDRHSVGVESDTCIFQEMYNLYPKGINTQNNCPECTSQSGVRYSGYGYTLPRVATDAASLYLAPLALHRDEVLAGSIQHALRVTLKGTFTQAAHIWPAMSDAGFTHSDVPPFGARFRLKSDFQSSSGNPFVQTLVTQLKRYGLILADIGGQWESDAADLDLYFEPEIRAALSELQKISPANFEVVDESSLMVSPTSGETAMDAERVIAKDKTGNVAAMSVVLAGMTIGTESQYMVMQAGAPPHQLRSWVNGSNDKTVSWSMKPAIGVLSEGGTYKAPSHLASRQELLLTVRARADSEVATSIKLTLLPEGSIRINNGDGSQYTDSQGSVWAAECCTPFAHTWDYSNYEWPNTKDIKLYRDDTVSQSDIGYRFYVPPGKYRITAKMAEPYVTSSGVRKMHLESQGQLVYRDVDLFAEAGLRNPLDFDLPAEVGENGRLDFAVRHVLGEQDLLSALEITSDPGIPRVQISSVNAGVIGLSQTKQFYPVTWYLPNKELTWSISPNIGSIDAKGFYRSPSNPVARDTPITVTVASKADSNLQAHAVITLRHGVPGIRVNCGGPPFVDSRGNLWAGDYGFKGGVIYDGAIPIKGAPGDLQKLYQSSRYVYRTDSFSYDFPVPDGNYSVTLKWAEYRTAVEVKNQQIAYKMSVKINDRQVLDNFDPIAAAQGVATAYDQTFKVNVTNGAIHFVFAGRPGAGYIGAGINGIDIEPVDR